MRHVRLQLEPSQIRDIVKWHFIDIEPEFALGCVASERSIIQPLSLLNFEGSDIALLLHRLLSFELKSVGVLMLLVPSEFVGVKSILSSVLRANMSVGK